MADIVPFLRNGFPPDWDASFTEFYERNYSYSVALARRKVPFDDAEDVAQISWKDFSKQFKLHYEESHNFACLCQTLNNRCKNYHRDRSRRPTSALRIEELNESQEAVTSIAKEFPLREIAEVIRKRVSEHEFEILMRHYHFGESWQELSIRYGVSIATICIRGNKARLKVRSELKALVRK